MGGGREAPELGENWSSGRRTKVSERAAQLGGGAGPASDAPGLLPVLVTAPGAGPPTPRPPPPTPPRDAGSAPHRWLPRKHVHRQRKGRGTIRAERLRPPPAPPPPPGPPGGGGRRDPDPEGAAAASGGGRTAARGPLRAGAVRGEDQSPRRGSKSAAQGAADAPTAQPRAGTPGSAPGRRAPPDTWRRRAGAVIPALLGPSGTRKGSCLNSATQGPSLELLLLHPRGGCHRAGLASAGLRRPKLSPSPRDTRPGLCFLQQATDTLPSHCSYFSYRASARGACSWPLETSLDR